MRSRVEAKWAIYFDAMGFSWEYELEGYELDGIRYLPDFWLPQISMWAEVKAGPFTETEREKCRLLATLSGHDCLMLDGPPAMKPYWAMLSQKSEESERPEQTDFALSNYKGYPKYEHRFYCTLCMNDDELKDRRSSFWFMFGDMEVGVNAARRARFEFGR